MGLDVTLFLEQLMRSPQIVIPRQHTTLPTLRTFPKLLIECHQEGVIFLLVLLGPVFDFDLPSTDPRLALALPASAVSAEIGWSADLAALCHPVLGEVRDPELLFHQAQIICIHELDRLNRLRLDQRDAAIYPLEDLSVGAEDLEGFCALRLFGQRHLQLDVQKLVPQLPLSQFLRLGFVQAVV